MHISADPLSFQLQRFMDTSSVGHTKEKLNMLKASPRIDSSVPPGLGNAILAGNRFKSVHCRPTSHVIGGNFAIDIDCHKRRKLHRYNYESRQLADIETEASEEETNLQRDCEVPKSPSPTKYGNTKNLNDIPNGYVGGGARGKGSPPIERVSRRHIEKSNDFPAVQGVREFNSDKRLRIKNKDNSSESETDNSSGINDIPKGTQNDKTETSTNCDRCTCASPNSEKLSGSNILRRLYASFGSESSHIEREDSVDVTKRSLIPSHIVKTEPNFEPFSRLEDRRQDRPVRWSKNSGDDRDINTNRSTVSSPVSERLRCIEDSTSSNNSQSPAYRYRSSDNKHLCNHTSHEANRKRNFCEVGKDKQLANDEMGRSKRPRRNLIDSQNDVEPSNLVSSDREKSPRRERTLSFNQSLKEDVGYDVERMRNLGRNNSYHNFAGPPLENILQSQDLSGHSAAAVQARILSSFPPNCLGGIGDPGLLLKSASLAAATSASPFLFGVNAGMINPFLLTGIERSEMVAATAYRQAMAARMLQSHAAAVKPFLGVGLMENPHMYHAFPHLMYGIPDSPHIATPMLDSLRYDSSGIRRRMQSIHPISAHPSSSGTASDMADENVTDTIDSPVQSPYDNQRSKKNVKSPKIDMDKDQKLIGMHCLKSAKPNRVESALPHPHLPPSKSPNLRLQGREFVSNTLVRHEVDFSPPRISKNSSTPAKKQFLTDSNPNHKSSLKDYPQQAVINARDEKNIESPCNEKSLRMEVKSSPSRTSSYKNLTRERRLVANARERTRVHTISSAFEELRQQIPSYSCNQKLSKLAILRIACSYIQSLSVLAGRSTEGTFKESVDQCTRVLQAESKARCRRKNTKAQVEWEIANYERSSLGADESRIEQSDNVTWPSTASPPHNRTDAPIYHQEKSSTGAPGVGSSADGSNESADSSPSGGRRYSAERSYSHEESSPVNMFHDDNSPSMSTEGIANPSLGEFSPINVED